MDSPFLIDRGTTSGNRYLERGTIASDRVDYAHRHREEWCESLDSKGRFRVGEVDDICIESESIPFGELYQETMSFFGGWMLQDF